MLKNKFILFRLLGGIILLLSPIVANKFTNFYFFPFGNGSCSTLEFSIMQISYTLVFILIGIILIVASYKEK